MPCTSSPVQTLHSSSAPPLHPGRTVWGRRRRDLIREWRISWCGARGHILAESDGRSSSYGSLSVRHPFLRVPYLHPFCLLLYPCNPPSPPLRPLPSRPFPPPLVTLPSTPLLHPSLPHHPSTPPTPLTYTLFRTPHPLPQAPLLALLRSCLSRLMLSLRSVTSHYARLRSKPPLAANNRPLHAASPESFAALFGSLVGWLAGKVRVSWLKTAPHISWCTPTPTPCMHLIQLARISASPQLLEATGQHGRTC